MAYNHKLFTEVLSKAIGPKKKKDFAVQLGISPFYLSKLLHQNFLRPPSMELLWKIAQVSESVSYKELLSACGYATKETEVPLPEPVSRPEKETEFAEATILTALKSFATSWTIRPQEDTGFDLVIEFPEWNNICWYFRFLPRFQEEYARQQRLNCYYQLLCGSLEKKHKYSIVTNSLQEFNIYTEQPPVNLNLNLSVLLIQESTLQIQNEYCLSYAADLDPNIKSLNLHEEGVCN